MKMIQFSILFFVVVIVLAHFFTPPEYNWTQNTVSDLAAQGMKYQWMMQAGFIGFGLLLNLGFVQKFIAAQKVSYPDLLIMLYGLAILLSGFFSTAPFIPGVSYSAQESNLHSVFATTAGIAFSLGILYRLVTAPTPAEKWQHALFLVLVMGTSLLFGLSESEIIPVAKGIVQRLLYLVSFLWLFSNCYSG
jgi:hypothetical membrane protein